MDKGQAFAEEFLAHYASKYYDPAKAKEYYERTKELKGRNPSAKDLGKNQKKKDAWEVANHQIGEAKKSESKQLSEDRKQSTEELRARIAERRDRISKKLTEALKSISETQKFGTQDLTKKQQVETKRIAAEVEAKIAALPEVPKGASKEQRARLTVERNAAIAKIRGDADTERKKLSESVNNDKGGLRYLTGMDRANKQKDAKSERETLGTELKASVEKARQDFKVKVEELKAKYEQEAVSEFERIKANA